MKKTLLFFVSIFALLTSCSTPEVSLVEKENQTEKKTKVILLAGGDNCLGYSYSYHLQDHNMDVSDLKMQEYRDGYSNVKILYKNMLSSHVVNQEIGDFENVRLGQGKVANEKFKDGIIGPELGIAEYLTNYYINEDVYILKFAGASSSTLHLEWNPDGGVYYQKMIEFFDNGLNKISNLVDDFEISAFCFMQGESDSRYFSNTYDNNLKKFVNSVKEKYYNYAPSNGMAFIDAGISRYYLNHLVINEIKSSLADSDGRNYYIDTIAAGIHNDKDNMDRKHYDAMGMLKLGNIFGRKIKESIEEKNYNTSLDYEGDVTNYNKNYGDYKISCISNGEYAYSQWNFTRGEKELNINVQVEDKYIYDEDGVEIRLSDYYDGEGLSYGTYSIQAFHNGDVLLYKHNGNEFAVCSELDIICKNRYIQEDNELKGYQLNISIGFSKKELGIAFSLINNNDFYINKKDYQLLKTQFNSTRTYMQLNNNILSSSPYLIDGKEFGEAYLFNRTGTWDLSKDNGEDKKIILTKPNYDSKIYLYNESSSALSVEMEFTATKVVNYDYFPKFGIKVTSINGNGIAFYVDAWGNGMYMFGRQLGYVTYTGDINNNNYTLIENAFVGDKPEAYQNGNTIKLGITRNQDVYEFYCNEQLVLELFDPISSGKLPAYMGVWSCNAGIEVTNYNLTTI